MFGFDLFAMRLLLWGVMAANAVLAYLLVRRLTDSRETGLLAALLLVVGAALFTRSIGLSMSLGAFLAGVLVADSEFRHELEADIEPFKGLLLGLFFMSVGMSARLGLLAEEPLLLLAVAMGLVAVKVVVMWALARVARRRGSCMLPRPR